ncbi:MAG: 2-C-methyl-D-erythritol 2,4-cyclodiphosphate synthase [Acidobacteria bacterium]|nr:MAG: 2-C-methyl-D-erythritol 2,4-cyclodiphosphate synthase [Acidobacteriota bacterium]
MTTFRVGMGQDSHPFDKNQNKPCVIGGVHVEGVPGLRGHSDGDVVVHALCAAIEQALGRTNFSTYADEMCKSGITDSLSYLAVAMEHLRADGYAVNNVGISIEALKPKILPIEDKMKNTLAQAMDVDVSCIGINATTGEGLTAFGRGEGVQAFVMISIIKK